MDSIMERGESPAITRHGKPVAEFVPVAAFQRCARAEAVRELQRRGQ